MHRIDSMTAEADKFGAGKDGWTTGAPQSGVPATEFTEEWCDEVQEEIANVIESTNATLTKGVYTQLLTALKQRAGVKAIADVFEVANAKNIDLMGCCVGLGLYVVVGRLDGADSYLLTCPIANISGTTPFTEQATIANKTLYAVAFNGSNLFVAVGVGDGTDSHILTSPDGAAWTERAPTVAKNIDLLAVAHNGSNLWVAVGQADGTDSYILTSPDGTTWTERAPTVAKNIDLNSVVWNSVLSLWVAVGDSDGTNCYILTSPDGTTWTERNPTVDKAEDLYGVAFHPTSGLLVAVGSSDGVDAYILTSPDGTTWTERTNPIGSSHLFDVLWWGAAQLWVATGGAWSSITSVVTSPDAVTWTQRFLPKQFDLNGMCVDGEDSLGRLLFAGDADGTDGLVLVTTAVPEV